MSKQPRCIRSNSSLVKLNPVSCPCLDLLSAGKKKYVSDMELNHIFIYFYVFFMFYC